MDIKNKHVLILGLGITGISTAKTLIQMGAKVTVTDDKSPEQLKEKLGELKDFQYAFLDREKDLADYHFSFCVKSPGIPPHQPLVKRIIEYQIPVISDLELAYQLWPNRKFIAITGTNGKTTTSSLIGALIAMDHKPVKVIGNIGIGMLWEIYNGSDDDFFVIEASSFQLENTDQFQPWIAGILNITTDHLDWHGSMDQYVRAKGKITINQKAEHWFVYNDEDPLVRQIAQKSKAQLIPFSINRVLQQGLFIENDNIHYCIKDTNTILLRTSDINLLGRHNLENVLMAVGVCLAANISIEAIQNGIRAFKGVSHRIEYVDTINQVKFYNDSKGTNVDASIKALEAVPSPIILLAGGYDKHVPLDAFFLAFQDKVKDLILFGDTKYKFLETARKYDFDNCHLVETMEEAIQIAYHLSEPGDNVLLSPASASWGMYPNFEVRGDHFKFLVHKLKESVHESKAQI